MPSTPLHHALTRKGLGVDEVAAKLGVSPVTVYRWLNGQLPGGQHLIDLAKLLDVSPDALYPATKQ